jgi:transposase
MFLTLVGWSLLTIMEADMPARKTPIVPPAPPAPTTNAAAPDAKAKGKATTRVTASLPVVHRHAAGIDIGAASHWVAIGNGDDLKDTKHDSHIVREFPAYTDGLKQIVAWLREHEVTTVAMESTGIYWIALYELLENEGFEVLLVDPSFTKQVKGRPKTDRLDCLWIQRLHSHGLLAAAFRPAEETCVLRSYLRQRANHVRYGGQHIQHMQKALEQMNVKLTEVIADITGMTGMSIIKAILKGERNPVVLAKMRDHRCKNSESTIAQALIERFVAGRTSVRLEASGGRLGVLPESVGRVG